MATRVGRAAVQVAKAHGRAGFDGPHLQNLRLDPRNLGEPFHPRRGPPSIEGQPRRVRAK